MLKTSSHIIQQVRCTQDSRSHCMAWLRKECHAKVHTEGEFDGELDGDSEGDV